MSSSSLVPPSVVVNTPRPQQNKEKDSTGSISLQLSNFVNSRPKSPLGHCSIEAKKDMAGRKSPVHKKA